MLSAPSASSAAQAEAVSHAAVLSRSIVGRISAGRAPATRARSSWESASSCVVVGVIVLVEGEARFNRNVSEPFLQTGLVPGVGNDAEIDLAGHVVVGVGNQREPPP